MRKRFAIIAIAAALVLPAAIGSTPAHAEGYGQTVHVVQPGDTLYSIARYYGVSPEALSKANDLMNPNFIWIGQHLIVPGSYMPGHDHEYPASAPAGGSYVVRPGDTLFSIAARFGTTVSALAGSNHLGNENVIFIGQTLVIPGGMDYGHRDNHDGGWDGGSHPEPAYNAKCGYYYQVSYGDTLSGIAARTGTTVYALAAANGIPYPYMVYAGQSLQIPCGVSYAAPVYYTAPPAYGHKGYQHDDHHAAPKSAPKKLQSAACARQVQIVRPLAEQHLSGVIQIIGTAVIDNFQFYKVEYAAGHSPLESAFNSIGDTHGTQASDTVLATWYVGNLPAGPYTLRLTAVDTAGQFVRPCDVPVYVGD
jgi:LysM repeat protein